MKFLKRSQKAGLPPGSLVYIGKDKTGPVFINAIKYNKTFIEEKKLSAQDLEKTGTEKEKILWINFNGIHDVDLLKKIGSVHKIHPLTLEDILNTHGRPKIEDMESYLFFCIKMIYLEEEGGITHEHISIILKKNLVITFQEKTGDVFDPIRSRIRKNKGLVRSMGADYLAYAIIDSIIDSYFISLEKLEDIMDELNEQILDPGILNESEILHKTHDLKRACVLFQKNVRPARELIGNLERIESPLFSKKIEHYLRDVYEHSIQVIDSIESLKDLVNGLTDLHLSLAGHRMNQIMKFLTIIATIFIPLTFLAGIYGMNFQHMPELAMPWAYPLILVIMATIGILMMMYFKKKKWL